MYNEFNLFLCLSLGFISGAYFGAKFSRDYYTKKYQAQLEKDTTIYELRLKNKYVSTLTTQKNKIDFLREYYKQGISAIRKECANIIDSERKSYDNENLLAENNELRNLYFSTLEKYKALEIKQIETNETIRKLERNYKETKQKLEKNALYPEKNTQNDFQNSRGGLFLWKNLGNGVQISCNGKERFLSLMELNNGVLVAEKGKIKDWLKLCEKCAQPFSLTDSRNKKCSNC